MNLGLGGMSASRGQADEEFFGSVYDQKVILRLIPYIKPYTSLVIISLVSMLVQSGKEWKHLEEVSPLMSTYVF